MKRVAGIFFDLDLTLLDYDDAAYARTVEAVCKGVAGEYPVVDPGQLRVTFQRLNSARWQAMDAVITPDSRPGERIWLETWVEALEGCACTDAAAARLALELYIDYVHRDYKLFADVLPVLTRLQNRFALAVVTNGPSDIQWDKLRSLELERFFDVCVVSGDVGVAKPHAAIFQQALDELGLAAEQVWHVGDSLRIDVAGAKSAGLGAVWLNRSDAPSDSEAQPDLVIHSLADLLEALGE